MGRGTKQQVEWRERSKRARERKKQAGLKPLTVWLPSGDLEILVRLKNHFKEESRSTLFHKMIKEIEHMAAEGKRLSAAESDKQAIYAKIKRLRDEGLSFEDIAMVLSKQGISPPPGAAEWNIDSVLKVIETGPF